MAARRTPRSVHVLAAVHGHRRAGDEIGLVRDQEQHRAHDVVGLAEAADGNAIDDLLQHLLGHRAHHVGVDVARRDGVHGDVDLGPFLRQRLGEAVDAGLGRRVVHLAVLAGLAVDRADVHDAPELALAHALDDVAAHVEAAGQVGADDLVPGIEAHLVQRAVPGDAGVVHQHLDRAEVLLDALDALATRLEIADVEAEGRDPGAVLECLGAIGAAHVIGCHTVARRRQRLGDGAADAARPARDHCHASCHGDSPPSCSCWTPGRLAGRCAHGVQIWTPQRAIATRRWSKCRRICRPKVPPDETAP